MKEPYAHKCLDNSFITAFPQLVVSLSPCGSTAGS